MELYIDTIAPTQPRPTLRDVQTVHPLTLGDRIDQLADSVCYDTDPDPQVDFTVNLYVGERV